MSKKTKYDVISPDGFNISVDKVYATIEEAEAVFEDWKGRYKSQGYYSSSRHGRIPLDDLKAYCKIVEV